MRSPTARSLVGTGAALVAASCAPILGLEDFGPLPQDSGVADSGGGDSNVGADADGPEDAGAEAADASPEASCTDTTSDTLNCGACGHDCLGGDCIDSVCQPVLLLGNLKRPNDLAVNDTHAYVVENAAYGRVIRVPKRGGAQKLIADVDWAQYICSVALGPEDVFFANCFSPDGRLMSCPLDGCVASPDLDLLVDFPRSMAYQNESLVWTEPITGQVWRYDLAASAGAPLAIVPQSANVPEPYRVAMRDGVVYLTDQGNFAVYRVGVDGEGLAKISAPQMRPAGIAASSTHVFWTTAMEASENGMIWKWPIGGATDGSAAQVVLQDNLDPIDVAADDDMIYWLAVGDSEGDGAVLARSVADGSVPKTVTLATQQARPWRIWADDKAVYWIALGAVGADTSGTLMMVAKP